LRDAIGTAAPIGDLGLVDLVALVVGRGETRGLASRALDVHDATADAADQVMVVVANAILVASRRTCRLDASENLLRDQHVEGVVDRLQRDRADLRSDRVCYCVGRDVRMHGNNAQDGQPLRGDLDSASPKEIGRVGRHERSISNIGNVQLLRYHGAGG
jgi:hypothetical protein